MTLRRRIMLLVTVGLIATTAPLGLMGVGTLRAATDRVLEERLAAARSAATHLDDRLSQGLRQLDQVGHQVGPYCTKGDSQGVRRALASAAPALDLFTAIVCVPDRGRILSLTLATGGRRAELPAAAADVIAQVVAHGRAGMSGVVQVGRTPAAIAVAPIPRRISAGAALLVGVILLPSAVLQEFVERLSVGATGHAAIVDEHGVVLASSEPQELFSRGEHPEFASRMISARRAGVELAEGTDPTGRSERHVMAFAPLSAAPWGLMVGQDESETYGPIRRLRDRVVFFGLGMLVLALVFAWLDTGAVSSPLRALKEAAERIAAGDLQHPITVRRSDEVGALAQSFETMRARLLASLDEIRRRARASQSLYEIGKEVLSEQDRDAVLRSVVHRAAALVAADVAVLCLTDEAGATARVAALAGPLDAVAGGTHVLPLRGSQSATACPDCTVLDARYRACHLAAPLTVGDRVVGALCVGARQARQFSPEERELLAGLANLAAIAVENARLREHAQSLAVLEERERIARELHDSVGQVLGYVNTKAQAVKVLLEAGRTDEARVQLGQLEDAARDAYADLREAILGLRIGGGLDRHLLAALREYVRRYSDLSGVHTELIVEGDPALYVFSHTTELQLLRIVQEALSNVRKHAAATRAWVRLARDDGVLRISVRDDGRGFDPSRVQRGAWPRFGLQTMRERAEAIGGTFAVRSRVGSGTEVEVRLPLAVRRSGDARSAGG